MLYIQNPGGGTGACRGLSFASCCCRASTGTGTRRGLALHHRSGCRARASSDSGCRLRGPRHDTHARARLDTRARPDRRRSRTCAGDGDGGAHDHSCARGDTSCCGHGGADDGTSYASEVVPQDVISNDLK